MGGESFPVNLYSFNKKLATLVTVFGIILIKKNLSNGEGGQLDRNLVPLGVNFFIQIGYIDFNIRMIWMMSILMSEVRSSINEEKNIPANFQNFMFFLYLSNKQLDLKKKIQIKTDTVLLLMLFGLVSLLGSQD